MARAAQAATFTARKVINGLVDMAHKPVHGDEWQLASLPDLPMDPVDSYSLDPSLLKLKLASTDE
jgi:hypothetical protein